MWYVCEPRTIYIATRTLLPTNRQQTQSVRGHAAYDFALFENREINVNLLGRYCCCYSANASRANRNVRLK